MSFIKDIFGGGAEKKAARAQEEGQRASIAEQRRQFDLTREDFAPSIEAGDLARERELEFLGLRGPEAEQEAIGGFIESPGQVFLRERQERALLRSQAATGGLGGGRIKTALQEQAFGRASTRLSERQDRLAGVTRGGLSAVGSQAGIGAGISARISGAEAGIGRARASVG